MSGQLTLELEPPASNPNAWMFNEDGTPKRLLWCGDQARMGGQCWYSSMWISPHDGELHDRSRFMPAGGCCHVIVGVACAVPWAENADVPRGGS